jgi:serine/threonine protein kinase
MKDNNREVALDEKDRNAALACAPTVDLSGSTVAEDPDLELKVNLILPSAEPSIGNLSLAASTNFSHVFHGRFTESGEPVVIKTLRYSADGCSDTDRRRAEDFKKEAAVTREAAAHPLNSKRDGIIRVYHSGEIEGFFQVGGRDLSLHYMATEPLEVDRHLEDLSNFQVSHVKKIKRMVWKALSMEVIHHAGYVHADFKPNNTGRCLKSGNVKIFDLGLAKPIGSKIDSDYIVATAEYAAPEVIGAGIVDARTDVFSFGVALFEVFNRDILPFDGVNRRTAPRKFIDPESIILGIDEVAYRCVRIKPAERYQSMGEVADALTACIS